MDDTITIPVEYFEHLLNCLASQKYLHNIHADTYGKGHEEIRRIQEQKQRVIDEAQRKGREMLSNRLHKGMGGQE